MSGREHSNQANPRPTPQPGRPAAVCLAILGVIACGSRSVAGIDSDGSTSESGTSEIGTSPNATSDEPMPPDLGSGAIVCGAPGEYVATDEDIALLAGCEIYRGGIAILSPNVTDLSPLASLRIIHEELAASGNADLQTLDGLEQLEWAGSVSFSQDGLHDLSALGNLAGVDDTLQFFALPNLRDCKGLEQLRTIGGNFSMQINHELTSLDGFSGLEWIGGNLDIAGNEKLESLEGLSGLVQVDGDVIIQLNPLLDPTEIDAFVSRVEIGGDIDVE